jgi:hypothetical protein
VAGDISIFTDNVDAVRGFYAPLTRVAESLASGEEAPAA